MTGNSEHDEKAEQRLTTDQGLAHEVLEWGKLFATRAAHSIEAAVAVESAVTIAKGAVMCLKYGYPEDGLRSLSIAQNIRHFAVMAALSPAADRGQPFIEGSKKSGRDALAKLTDNALAVLPPKATAMDVLAKVHEIDGERVIEKQVIQEIDRDDPEAPVILWRARDGREKKTEFKSFQNRLTGYREKIHGT